ncbi:MAG: transposase [Hyphomicrobiales bacterium]|nr:transposase [Hyphomicrobiales bacterium]
MAHISGIDRTQMLLLPERVEDYVGADNQVRFIDAFVDELDLQKAGFAGVDAEATGRPGYYPADLLKLNIYGYLNRVRLSRRLEVEAHRNIEVIWVCWPKRLSLPGKFLGVTRSMLLATVATSRLRILKPVRIRALYHMSPNLRVARRCARAFFPRMYFTMMRTGINMPVLSEHILSPVAGASHAIQHLLTIATGLPASPALSRYDARVPVSTRSGWFSRDSIFSIMRL